MSITTKLKRREMSLNVLCGVLGDVIDTSQNKNLFFIWECNNFRQLKSKLSFS